MLKCIGMQNKNYDNFHLLTMTCRTDVQQSPVHQKGCYAYQWLENVDMHKYAIFDQSIPCGSRVFYEHFLLQTTDGRTNGQTHAVVIVHTAVM